jgi:hypothetical protein
VVTLRCLVDGLLLNATLGGDGAALTAYDGDEGFGLGAVEAALYEIVTATADELLALQQAHYRLLRLADDFVLLGS